jgi:hypothetical protein
MPLAYCRTGEMIASSCSRFTTSITTLSLPLPWYRAATLLKKMPEHLTLDFIASRKISRNFQIRTAYFRIYARRRSSDAIECGLHPKIGVIAAILASIIDLRFSIRR